MIKSENKAIAIINGKPVSVTVGLPISAVVATVQPCGGKGKCGKCKVKASGKLSEMTENEHTYLTKTEIKEGIRLACKTVILGDCIIETLKDNDVKVLVDGTEAELELDPIFNHYGVAVDIGTTTIAIKLYDASGKLLAESGAVNPQNVFGADVISRVEHALKGEHSKLVSVLSDAVDSLVFSVARKAEVDVKRIDGAVITGNTVMLSFLKGESIEPFSHAPFIVDKLFGEYVKASELGLKSLSENALIYLPSCVSAFVGADVVCAMTAVDFDQKSDSVIADIGTNGEIAVVSNGEIKACSTSAGPAFEGVGLSCGMGGESGAIEKCEIVNGRLACSVIDNERAKGICGSGIVDVVACLLNLEELDESGYLESEVKLADGVAVNQNDVRSVQLAKSAICAGIKTLLYEGGIKKPEEFYIAGGFGRFLNVKNAERIGLIPQGFARISTAVGNAALVGASMMLLSKNAIEKSERIRSKTTTVELNSNKFFVENYIEGMSF